MKYVSKAQLVESFQQLAVFRGAVNKQLAQHILPFLALRWRNVGTESIPYSERDDFAFFDEFARVDDGDFPYFDPFAAQMRIETHPHSNVATARKGTFFRSWHAGEQDVDENGVERWRLTVDYLNILKKKVLMKAGRPTKVPAIPLGIFLLRARSFPDSATTHDVGQALKGTFNLTDQEYSELFEETTHPSSDFATAPLSPDEVLQAVAESGVVTETRESPSTFQELTLTFDHPIVEKVKLLLEDGYAGVTFVGPPGTSKSWFAIQVALALTDGDQSRVRKIQFHPSFQYEQFVQGFVPNEDGTGFELRDQLMVKLIEDADVNRGAKYVVLIDELSRSDPGRVFGELLTYMEPTRRDEPFLLASGREIVVPPNIVFIATMNSRDKNVSEIDDAFDRRMAKIEFPPDEKILDVLLSENRMADDLRRRVSAFFRWVNTKYPLGHTFFRSVKDADGLKRLWETQLRFVFEKHYRYEPGVMDEIRLKFVEITGVAL
jgi:5-methylcytosine-specific restriction enzyme B